MADFENSTRTPIIRIGTGEAVNSVKDLRDNIKDLRDEIVALSNSEEQNADTTKLINEAEQKLIASQQELNRVMGLTKQGADGVAGSYNRLKAELRETKQQMDAIPKIVDGQLNPAWTRLADKYKELNRQAKEYDFELGNFQRNVGNYGNAFSSIGKSMGEVQQVGGDMSAGIQAAAGVMNIAGINADGLDESMKNLRLSVGLVQGVKGFAGLIKTLVKFVTGSKAATVATKENTAANQANTASLEATAAAETAASTAGTVLKGVLMSLGIGVIVAALGLLIANFEKVVEWAKKVATNLGLIDRESEKLKQTNENLTAQFEKQNENLDEQLRIQQAQGVSNREILQQKKKLIETQIAETKATIENIKMRIEQLKADKKWWQFWKGGDIKAAEKEMDEINETLANLEKKDHNINIDITVDEETTKTNARKKAQDAAAKAAEEAAKKIAEAIKKGEDTAKTAIDATKDELTKINEKYDEEKKLIEGALTELKNQKDKAKEILALQNGLKAVEKLRTDKLEAYYKKEYEKKQAAVLKDINRQYETGERSRRQQYEYAQKVLGITKEEFNYYNQRKDSGFGQQYYINQEVRASLLETTGLLEKLGLTEEQVFDETGNISTAFYNAIEEAYELNIKDPEAYAKKFNEPIGTAIVLLRENLQEFKDLKFDEEIVSVFDRTLAGLQSKIDNKNWAGAFNMVGTLKQVVESQLEELGVDKLDPKVVEMLQSAGTGYFQTILDGIMDDNSLKWENWKLGYKLIDAIIPKGSEDYAMKRLIAISSVIDKFTSKYTDATSNLLDNVADLWQESLKAQGKTNKEAFEGVKALQYSSAVINTSAAIVQALADPSTPTWYLKVANAAAAAAAGAAQIIKIANTDYGSGTASASTPKLVDRTPQLQYTYGLNPADYAAANAANPVRCYVVDKDLADGLNNYQELNRETTF